MRWRSIRRMGTRRGGELPAEPLALCLPQRGRLGKAFLGLVGKVGDGLPQCQELPFGVAHEFHEDMPLAATATAKAPHDLCEFLFHVLGLALEGRRPAATLLDDVVDERERFFVPYTGWWHP